MKLRGAQLQDCNVLTVLQQQCNADTVCEDQTDFLCFVQELTETRHKLNEVQQQLQDSSSAAVQQEQQASQKVARLTHDLQQEQESRSALQPHMQSRTLLLTD